MSSAPRLARRSAPLHPTHQPRQQPHAPQHPQLQQQQQSQQANSPGFFSSLRHVARELFPLNLLLVFVPLGILAAKLEYGDVVVFWLNFIGIIPLAMILGHATEDLALRTSPIVGGLLNATFGNAVEMIIAIVALNKGLIRLVQTSLLGSIISNLLFVTGFSFLLGGFRFSEQQFSLRAADTSMSMLTLSVMALILPAAYSAGQNSASLSDNALLVSRFSSVVLLVVYACYLTFQLYTHARIFAPVSATAEPVPLLSQTRRVSSAVVSPTARRVMLTDLEDAEGQSASVEENAADDDEEPKMTVSFALGLMAFSTFCVSVSSEYLVACVEGLTKEWGLSPAFVGLILLPIVGDATEHLTAVTVAMKNKMDLALAIAMGSSMQISLFALPLTVVIGWIIGQPMSLNFELFETASLFVSVLMVNYLLHDGISNWFEGSLLISTYTLIAIGLFYTI